MGIQTTTCLCLSISWIIYVSRQLDLLIYYGALFLVCFPYCGLSNCTRFVYTQFATCKGGREVRRGNDVGLVDAIRISSSATIIAAQQSRLIVRV